MAANQYKVKRVNIAFTDADKDNIQSVRAAHGFPTNTAAIRWALDLAAADAALDGAGAAAIEAIKAYQRLDNEEVKRLAFGKIAAAFGFGECVDTCECEAADAEVHAQFKARQNNSPPAYPPPLINTGVHLRAERADAITEAECGATDGVAVDCDSADYEAENICGFCIHQRRQNRLQSAAEWARRKA